MCSFKLAIFSLNYSRSMVLICLRTSFDWKLSNFMSICADYESITTLGCSFAGDPITSSLSRSCVSPAIILPQRRRIRAVDQFNISLGVIVPSRSVSISSNTRTKSDEFFYLLYSSSSLVTDIYSRSVYSSEY